MDSRDIFLFANMPKVDVFSVDTLNRELSITNIDKTLDFIETQFNVLDSLEEQKRNLIIHGSTENIDTALEALSQSMKAIWEGIKAAFIKILEWLGLDTYFTNWLSTSRSRLVNMEKLIKTKERFYTNADATKFKQYEIVGFDFNTYSKLLTNLYNASQKINSMCTGSIPYERIDVENTFVRDITPLGFVVKDGEIYEPSAIGVDKKSLESLGWSPTSVHLVTSRLHTLLMYTIKTDSIGASLGSILNASIKMCDDNLNPNTESDANQLAIAKKRLANIRKIRKICAWIITYTSVMTRQWTAMVNKFDIEVI